MSATALVTEFLLAAEEGNIDALKACLEKGVDINATNRQKRTAIIIASLKRHYACVEFLIAAGADIDKQDQTCFNPFLIGCLTNDLTLLRIVLPANPDLDRLTRFGGVGITPASEKGTLKSCVSCWKNRHQRQPHQFCRLDAAAGGHRIKRRRRKAAGNCEAAARSRREPAHDR